MADIKTKSTPEKKTEAKSIQFQQLFGLTVVICEAKELPAADVSGTSDPFLKFSIGSQSGKTKTIEKNLAPKWNETFSFVFPKIPKSLKIEVWDWDRISSDDFLGAGELDIGESFFFPEKEGKDLKTTSRPSAIMAKAALFSKSTAADENPWSLMEVKNVKGETTKVKCYNGWFQIKAKNKKPSGWVKLKIAGAFIPQAVGRTTDHSITSSYDDFVELLELTVVGGRSLASKDVLSACDPFVKIVFGKHQFSTTIQFDIADPVWNQFCPVWLTSESCGHLIKFSVLDAKHAKATTDITKAAGEVVGNAFVRLKTLKAEKKYRLMLPLVKDDPQTDAELSSLLQKLKFDPEAEHPPKSELGYLEIKIERRPKAEVMDEFYKSIVNAYDLNKDGKLDSAEVVHMCGTIGSKLTTEEIIKIFKAADEDKSGCLSKAEVLKMFSSKSFQDENLMKKLFVAMQYGKDGLENLLNGGLFADEIQQYEVATERADTDNQGTQILIQDRQSGLLVRENIPTYLKSAMKLGYRTGGGLALVESARIRETLKSMTIYQGQMMDDPRSVHKIDSFILLHHLNVEEIEKPLSEYKTFNEFFYRKLKPGARVVAAPTDNNIALSPADARVSAFASFDDAKKLWIKGDKFTIHNLLGEWGDDGKADEWNGGALVIARLAPQDYHRWHFPVAGTPGLRFPIDGGYDTVNPIAIRHNVNVYTENKRVVCPIETKEFGTVLLVAIGATAVGSIRFECDCKKLPTGTYNCADGKCKAGTPVKKFDPHGYFAFGGSTTLVLFKPGTITLNRDLIDNSNKNLETLVKVGESIGTSTGYAGKKS